MFGDRQFADMPIVASRFILRIKWVDKAKKVIPIWTKQKKKINP